MSDRRDDYAAAIRDAGDDDRSFSAFYQHADAAMAIADAELEDAYTVARVIRKDLESTRDENTRLRAALQNIDNNIQNGGASTEHVIRSIKSIVRQAL